MPLDENKQYTVLSLGVPPLVLDALGICSVATPNADELASICLAFSCEGGGCTIASQLSGAALSCFAGNPDVDASTEGVSEIAGEAVALSLESTGFGLSLTGDFSKPQKLWGANDDFTSQPFQLKANMYADIAVADEMLPESLQEMVELTGDAYYFFQVGDGSASQYVGSLFAARSPLSVVRAASSLSAGFHGSIEVALKLDEITPKGLLANLELGSAVEVDGLLSTQTVGGLAPGLHLYASAGFGSPVAKAFSWLLQGFGDILDKVAGKTGFGSRVLDAINDLVSKGGDSSNEFGMYLTETAFATLFNFPAGDIIRDFLPPFVPTNFLGIIKLKCHVDFSGSDTGFACGVDYGEPRWLAAVWKSIDGVAKKVFGAIKSTADDAFSDARAEADKAGAVITHAAGAVATWTKTTAHKVATVVQTAVEGNRRRRRFFLRRRRRGHWRRSLGNHP